MQTINLNQNSFRLFPTIYMVQNDTGRELKMILDDVTLDGTETGAVAIKRSDGSYYTIPATIDTTNNAFDADMTQALTQPSRTECQLKVTASDDTVISTYTFIIMVQPSTDGISEEQLGYSVQQLEQDARDVRAGGMPYALRAALLQIAQKVAYIDDQGEQYYQDLYDALQPSVVLVSISAEYTQSGTIYTDDTLTDIETNGTLVVTAHYSDTSSEVIPSTGYTLSGSLTAGTSSITVTYEEQTATFDVTVTAPLYSIPDFAEKSVTVSSRVYKISKSGNYFTIKGKGSASVYIYPDGTCSATAPTATLFTVQVGDELVSTADVTSWTNPTSTPITAHFKYSRTDTTGNLYTATCPMAANGSGSGGVTDFAITASLARPVGGFCFQSYDNPGTSDDVSITFRPKLFVNGVRYL